MSNNRLLRIINEEIHKFLEGSYEGKGVGDKYFDRLTSQAKSTEQLKNLPEYKLSGKLVGLIGESRGRLLSKAIPVYLNPENLDGFESSVRGVLTSDLDIYLAQGAEILHEDLFPFLYKIGAIQTNPGREYGSILSPEHVGIVRVYNSKVFMQSNAYHDITVEYRKMFGEANVKYGGRYVFHIVPSKKE
ncbi:MAG: hypothetical protein WC333_01910 [Dehalococcoidia bacterium]|jgi:hypothetical protein